MDKSEQTRAEAAAKEALHQYNNSNDKEKTFRAGQEGYNKTGEALQSPSLPPEQFSKLYDERSRYALGDDSGDHWQQCGVVLRGSWGIRRPG